MNINEVQFNAELSDILKELKAQLELNRIPLLHGKMIDTGSNIQVCCIYHNNGQERRPSAGIHKQTGVYHCFTCGETHQLQEFISDCFGYYNDAGTFGWNWLLKNFLTIQVENRSDIALDVSRDKSTDKKLTLYVSDEELDSYRYYHKYMYERKLTDEIIEKFDIGFDGQSQCITFPIRDISGNTLFIARRSVSTKYFNYPSEAIKPLYGVYELSQLAEFPKTIIVCESMLDCLVCWVYGDYAVALNGLGSNTQYEELRNLPCRELVLATDNDDAGREARRKIKANVKNKLISEFVIPSNKKDLNDLTEEEYRNMKKVY